LRVLDRTVIRLAVSGDWNISCFEHFNAGNGQLRLPPVYGHPRGGPEERISEYVPAAAVLHSVIQITVRHQTHTQYVVAAVNTNEKDSVFAFGSANCDPLLRACLP
jgi:hypothetical protein